MFWTRTPDDRAPGARVALPQGAGEEADNEGMLVAYRCRSCGARLEVKVPFKGRLAWVIDPSGPDFSSAFPEQRGRYDTSTVACSAAPLHNTGFHLIDGSIVRNLAAKAWD